MASLAKADLKLIEDWYDDPDLFDRDVWPELKDQPEPWQAEASKSNWVATPVGPGAAHG